MKILVSALVTAISLMMAAPSWAQKYPDKPIRMVVPYVAGGNLDVISRLFAQSLSEELGQPVVVDNRPGANGNTGMEQVARSPANGYTIAMVAAGTMAINPSLYRTMAFDPEKDLAPVSLVASGPLVLQINNALPIQNFQELIAYAKANPGKLNFGSGGNGTLSHLSFEMLRQRTGIDIIHVPYKGTSIAVNDLIAGHIQAMFDTLSTAAPMINEGKVRGIAVTSAKRSEAIPNLPTVSEAGVKDYSADAWSGLVVPAGTPRDIIVRLQTAIAKIGSRDIIQKRLGVVGSEAVGSTPEQFAATIRAERVRWAEIVKVSGARVD
ncbi:MAG: tripartite tricarboxylate transporter substrate binding protein [Limnohabitans sp.]|nr:tripartite tricarboxylate transporter substrate binding protein [Limnohabitans sp.]